MRARSLPTRLAHLGTAAAVTALAACGPMDLEELPVRRDAARPDTPAESEAPARRDAAPDRAVAPALDASDTGRAPEPLDAARDAAVAPDAGRLDVFARTDATRLDATRLDALADAPRTDAPTVPTDAPVPASPAARTAMHICPRVNADRAASVHADAWRAGSTACAPGTLPRVQIDDALRTTNLYRWLAGLPAVTTDANNNAAAQACAVLLEQNGALEHEPPRTWRCWTSLGYEGTSHSNIMGGAGWRANPLESIDGWIDDDYLSPPQVGHRRWILYPPLGPVGYGQAASYSCLYVLDERETTAAKQWVAWPNEGATPMETMTRIWSFGSATLGVTSSTRVAVTRDGAAQAVTTVLQVSGVGHPAVAWRMPAAIAPDALYHVRVTGLSSGRTIEYDVRPVTCAGR